jgi:hypothetical protein
MPDDFPALRARKKKGSKQEIFNQNEMHSMKFNLFKSFLRFFFSSPCRRRRRRSSSYVTKQTRTTERKSNRTKF